MLPVAPLPAAGEVFLDARGSGRALRVSWHGEADLVVLSLWNGDTCSGTFRLPVEQVPDLIDVLRDGLARSYDVHRARLARSTATSSADEPRLKPSRAPAQPLPRPGSTPHKTRLNDALGLAREI